jgi:poly-gamma-glutamate capsule biosynthesis protein CapA/YwtB (metallophosphatase superfamily)
MTWEPNGQQSWPPPPPAPAPPDSPTNPLPSSYGPPPPAYSQPVAPVEPVGPANLPPGPPPEPPRRRTSIAPWFLLTTLLVVVIVAFGAVIVMRGQAAPPDSNQPPIEEPAPSDAGPDAFPTDPAEESLVPSEAPASPSTTSEGPSATTSASASAPAGATDGPTSSNPTVAGGIPIVPVVSFWSTQTDESLDDLKSLFSGTGDSANGLVVTSDDADAIATALGVTLGNNVQKLSVDQVRKQVSKGALGLMPITDVDPSVRALSIDGVSLFGNERVKDTSTWPLAIEPNGSSGWDQSTTWTLVAGGDMFLDRGVYREVVQQKKGVDFPFDGGTAIVTGHHCCGQYVTTYQIPDVELTGNAGVVRSLVKDADLSMANLETPVPDNWVYHAHDYTFSSDPDLLPMFTDAGIDLVTIANNHIKDFGTSGIADTRKNLEAAGLQFVGAGANLQEAGQIAYLHANGTTVGVIGCQGVESSYYATATSAGALPCTKGDVNPLIAQAKQHASLVIVFAHWGIEYQNDPTSSQESLAQTWAKAGAGLILGAHPHVPGAIGDYDGTVTFFSLGNFIFDQTFRTATMESVLPEMTFQGNKLVQVTLHPYVDPDTQPNFLNPATDDGKAVLNTIKKTSQQAGLNW